MDSAKNSDNMYKLEGTIPLKKAIPLGLQHIMAMFVSNITPIIILTGICAGAGTLPADASVYLIQNAMIIAGIGTLIQLFPVAGKVGSGLPIVMGISFTFLSVAIAVGTNHGYGTLMGAVLIGGAIEGILGLFAKYWIKIISPVVAATVVIGIGFSLLPVGANSFAGGQGASDFGAAHHWIIGSVTLLTCLIFTIFGKGFIKRIAVLFGLSAGYITALILGQIDFSPLVKEIEFVPAVEESALAINEIISTAEPVKAITLATPIIALPHIMPVGFDFNIGAILSFVVIYLVSATETIGDTTAVCSVGLNREASEKEMSGSLACDGFVSSLAACFGCTPITSFSQNIGLVQMTKVVNRFAIACGAVIMILAGFFPVLGALLRTVPNAVLGGCTIMMFGMIVVSGFQMFSKCGFSTRNITICALALSIGLGFTEASAKAMFNIFPEIIKNVFAENCVATVFILAIILNLVLPKEESEE